MLDNYCTATVSVDLFTGDVPDLILPAFVSGETFRAVPGLFRLIVRFHQSYQTVDLSGASVCLVFDRKTSTKRIVTYGVPGTDASDIGIYYFSFPLAALTAASYDCRIYIFQGNHTIYSRPFRYLQKFIGTSPEEFYSNEVLLMSNSRGLFRFSRYSENKVEICCDFRRTAPSCLPPNFSVESLRLLADFVSPLGDLAYSLELLSDGESTDEWSGTISAQDTGEYLTDSFYYVMLRIASSSDALFSMRLPMYFTARVDSFLTSRNSSSESTESPSESTEST